MKGSDHIARAKICQKGRKGKWRTTSGGLTLNRESCWVGPFASRLRYCRRKSSWLKRRRIDVSIRGVLCSACSVSRATPPTELRANKRDDQIRSDISLGNISILRVQKKKIYRSWIFARTPLFNPQKG